MFEVKVLFWMFKVWYLYWTNFSCCFRDPPFFIVVLFREVYYFGEQSVDFQLIWSEELPDFIVSSIWLHNKLLNSLKYDLYWQNYYEIFLFNFWCSSFNLLYLSETCSNIENTFVFLLIFSILPSWSGL